jgi:hypothetical protein|tara:strand:+ start:434 stop:1042 length:609 start_codon:yes stop_codon:yes gene_type:complete
MDRKRKLRTYQTLFLLIGLGIILLVYSKIDLPNKKKIISSDLQKKIDSKIQSNKNSSDTNIFYNVEYSGFDLEGNRYKISSNEAINSSVDLNLVEMKGVFAVFIFKDGTKLDISSEKGSYNNSTLDMEFRNDVKAVYEDSKLYANKAEFLNSKNSLIISNNVKVVDTRGTMNADKLVFDIKKKSLNITSDNNDVVKTKVNKK